MTVVLVHGNPETSVLWEPLRAELQRDDIVALSPPGFGAPVPEGFGATADEYLAWLMGALETMGEPVDIVGHDWGGAHVLRLACSRPDLIRSWCSDVAGVLAPDYIWHDPHPDRRQLHGRRGQGPVGRRPRRCAGHRPRRARTLVDAPGSTAGRRGIEFLLVKPLNRTAGVFPDLVFCREQRPRLSSLSRAAGTRPQRSAGAAVD